MAVFQGARLRAVGLPATDAERHARILTQAPVRSAHRIRPAGLLMAAILTATMVGLVYLTQTLASNATSLEIRSLAGESQDLRRQLLNQRSAIQLGADPDRIADKAKRLGLVSLDDELVLPAP